MKLIGRICFVSALIMMLPPSMANAQKKNVVLHYDFKSAAGTVVKDRGPFHADAQLMNGAKVENGALCLGASDGYLDMTESAG